MTPGNTAKPDLLPCPFCGSEPHYSEREDEDIATHNIVKWKSVHCLECDAQQEMPDGYEGGTAVERWNRRAPTAKPDSNGWLPIESAPKDGTAVLTYRAAGFVAVAEYIGPAHEWCIVDGLELIEVTHWQPLPAPPVSEEG